MGDGLGVERSPSAPMDSAAPSAAVEASLGGGGCASLRASARPGRRCEEPLERRRRLVVAAALMVGAALLAGTLASPHGSMASMPSPCSWPPRGSPAAWRRGRYTSDDDAGGPTSAVNCWLQRWLESPPSPASSPRVSSPGGCRGCRRARQRSGTSRCRLHSDGRGRRAGQRSRRGSLLPERVFSASGRPAWQRQDPPSATKEKGPGARTPGPLDWSVH